MQQHLSILVYNYQTSDKTNILNTKIYFEERLMVAIELHSNIYIYGQQLVNCFVTSVLQNVSFFLNTISLTSFPVMSVILSRCDISVSQTCSTYLITPTPSFVVHNKLLKENIQWGVQKDTLSSSIDTKEQDLLSNNIASEPGL